MHESNHGLAVMHSTQTNIIQGLRSTAGYSWCQEGHPVLNACARTKVFLEAPFKPQGIGEMEVRLSK